MTSQLPTQKRAPHQVSPPYFSTIVPPSLAPLPTRSGSSAQIVCPSGGSLMAGHHARRRWGSKKSSSRHPSQCQTLINMLPDEVLLEIFDFYVDKDQQNYEYLDEAAMYDEGQSIKDQMDQWQSLAHVCRQWRRIVFGSQRRLHLRLVCTAKTPARDTLDIWPALPLLILDRSDLTGGVDNVVAALKHSNRVDTVQLSNVAGSLLKKILVVMQEPFPELRYLVLSSNGQTAPALPLPDSFLGGSAPRLRILSLAHIPFPGLPKLILSATHLVILRLLDIPHSGYISPEGIITCLSTLRNLYEFALTFESPLSRPDRAGPHRPPLTRFVLPALYRFHFNGVSEYLEDLVAHVDAPDLGDLEIAFFNQIYFGTPQLVQFIRRTPVLHDLKVASLAFGVDAAGFNFSTPDFYGDFNVSVSCRELDWQVSFLEQYCTSFLPPPQASAAVDLDREAVMDLYTEGSMELHIFQRRDLKPPDWKDNVENELWLALLRPFTAVGDLYLSKEFAPRILPALQQLVGRRTTEVMPTLRNIFLEELQPSGPVQEAIKTIVAARQLSGHPVTVSLRK